MQPTFQDNFNSYGGYFDISSIQLGWIILEVSTLHEAGLSPSKDRFRIGKVEWIGYGAIEDSQDGSPDIVYTDPDEIRELYRKYGESEKEVEERLQTNRLPYLVRVRNAVGDTWYWHNATFIRLPNNLF